MASSSDWYGGHQVEMKVNVLFSEASLSFLAYAYLHDSFANNFQLINDHTERNENNYLIDAFFINKVGF